MANALNYFKQAQADMSNVQTNFQTLQGKVPPDMLKLNDLFKEAVDAYLNGANLYVTAVADDINGKQTVSTFNAQLLTASNYIIQGNSYMQEAIPLLPKTSPISSSQVSSQLKYLYSV